MDKTLYDVKDCEYFTAVGNYKKEYHYKLSKNKLQQQIFFLCDIIEDLSDILVNKQILTKTQRIDIIRNIDKIDRAEVSKNIFTY